MTIDPTTVTHAAIPVAMIVGAALAMLAGWLSKFLGSWIGLGVFALVTEFTPRLLGLGQGLISWGAGLAASAALGAMRTALSIAGIEMPSFNEILGSLPPGIVWAGSALRVHKVVGILVAIPVVKLLQKVFAKIYSSSAVGKLAGILGGGS
jgi:hypothetical protein